jgi:hypothetical protein
MYNTQVIDQVELLVDCANPALDISQCLGAQLIKSPAQNSQFPGGWKQRPIKQPDQRAFSSAAGSNQSNPLTHPNLEINILQGRETPKFPADLG